MNMETLHHLITRHDYFHVHKIMGTLSLAHFAYQYTHLLWNGSFNLSPTILHWTLPLHTALSLSSLLFRIPQIRNPVSPMIYPEFRIHSICFAVRSILCCYMHLYNIDTIYKIGVCFATMAAADIATHYTQTDPPTHTTMRNMPFAKTMSKYDQHTVIHMQSTMQVGATLFMLGNVHTAFAPLCAIQLAAFLMTLVRKNILTASQWHQLYTISLAVNVMCYYSVPSGWTLLQIGLSYMFTYLRFQRKLHKYMAWTCVFGTYMWWVEYADIPTDVTQIVSRLLYYANSYAFQRTIVGCFAWTSLPVLYCLFTPNP